MSGPYKKAIVRKVSRRTILEWGGASLALLLAACKSDGGQVVDTGLVPGPDRLEPITPISDFYVVSHFGMAEVDVSTWSLEFVYNGVLLGALDYAFLESLEAREIERTLQCVESRPAWIRMSNAVFEGLPLFEILDAAGVDWRVGASHMAIHSMDFYSVGLGIDEEEPPWLVWRMNGEVLPQKHGYPARILAPNRYGWLNPKQVKRVELLDAPYVLPWVEELERYAEAVGLHSDSELTAEEVRIQSVVVYPDSMQFVESGHGIRLLGKAYGGRDPVVEVSISEDGGQTYQSAEITYAPGADRWTLWRHVWRPTEVGTHLLHVRARSKEGVSTDDEYPENQIPYTGGMWILVEVL